MHRFRMAMVGGGPGSFIGPVHVMAAQLDGDIELVAGAFSSRPEKSAEAGRSYRITPERTYRSCTELLTQEQQRPDRADFLTIATPNVLHFEAARAALRAGFHVVSDKPATTTLREALELREEVSRSRKLYVLTHTYTGYPLVREARDICRSGALGDIRKVVVEYTQGWLTERLELGENRQAAWRTDPAQAGAGGCIGDIGVHAFNLLEYVTGRQVAAVFAVLSRIVPGRALDDDCNVLLRLDNGAPGILHASQIALGERNRLDLRVYGSKGSISWKQEEPNRLTVHWPDRPSDTRHAGCAYLGTTARQATRLPAGHPEGYIEAFANIYREFAGLLHRRGEGDERAWSETLCGIEAGVRGMTFIERAIESSERSAWVQVD
ncbi:MAG: Gfo/Idh/MocA family oxidoreductase [Pseudomonadota bacterium]|nr:Gfo/Idh/MocA family oxidoreductase [Pseudomonadota bacterium]